MSKKKYEFIENEFYVMISGDRACFTDPLFRVDRRSLDFITPGAAASILACVYGHPFITWDVLEIRVINPIKTYTEVTNELRSIKKVQYSDFGKGKFKPINITEDRIQRSNCYLKDVCYIVKAKIIKKDEAPPGFDFNIRKCIDIFMRRMESERFFSIPHLGLREFPAVLKLIPKEDLDKYPPIKSCRNYGLYPHYVDSANMRTSVFPAIMENGVINCNAKEVEVKWFEI